VRDCLLTVYGEDANVLVESRVVIPPLPEKGLLERLYREYMDGRPLRYAVAREERVVRALYLAEDLVPKLATRFGPRKGRVGRWATSSVMLGQGVTGRVLLGPELFFRQIDLGPEESWLAPILMGFGVDVETRAFPFGDTTLWEWELRGDRYYYMHKGARWSLYGAGNTPGDRIDRAIAEANPATPADLLWTIGGVPIARQRARTSLQGL
jgi:hypothetical protein